MDDPEAFPACRHSGFCRKKERHHNERIGKEASADARLEKVAADTLATKKYVDKVASILREDHGEDDERLFRSCASTVVHLKLAGRIKPEFDNPRDLAEMAYHLYGDILDNQ